MKRKASLILIELMLMLLVFALAAALCVQAFVWADDNSRQSQAADAALMQAQNAAELLKHHRGEFSMAAADFGGLWDGDSWTVFYDEHWNITSGAPVYSLQAKPQACETAYLGQAQIIVVDAKQTTLTSLSVCWQEVAP